MGYQTLAIKGVSWVGLLRLALRGGAFIKTAFLARLLTPAQFGVFGIAAIVLGLLEMFTETGINIFLIQEDDKNSLDKYLDTAYTASIIRGVVIFILIIACTPIIARFFQEPEVVSLLLLSATIPLIRGFINPAVVNFQKQLNFHREFWFRNSTYVIDGCVAILVAYYFHTPAALVWGMIAAALLEVVLSQTLIKPTPKLDFNKTSFTKIIQAGKWITGAGIFEYTFQKGPDIAIGRLVSTQALGSYQMAYRFAGLPITEMIDAINRVSFPIYVKIIDDNTRVIRALKRNYLVILSAGLPLIAFVMIFTPQIITIGLGSDWLFISPIMRSLAIISLLRLFIGPLSSLFLAAKKQSIITLTSLIKLLILLALIIPCTLYFGILGSIFALTLSIVFTLPVYIYFFIRFYRASSHK